MLTKHLRNRSRWGIWGVWAWLGLGFGCSKEAEWRPTYRFEGRVVLAGTEQGPGQSLTLLVGVPTLVGGYDTLARIRTDDSGFFVHALSSDFLPNQLRLLMDSLPPQLVQPPNMPQISGYGMTQLRIEIPARAWLRLQLDLTGMTPGGMMNLIVGNRSEFFFQADTIVRTIPWVSGTPLGVEGTYLAGPSAPLRSLDTFFVLEPFRVTEWSWAP